MLADRLWGADYIPGAGPIVFVGGVDIVRVRLTRKLADRIDGVDISGHRVGDTLSLPTRDAELLVAEGWAIPEPQRKP